MTTHQLKSRQIASTEECPECGGSLNWDDARGEVTCSDCGCVVDENSIDHGKEWRDYGDSNTSPARTGPANTRSRHDRGLSTEIGTTSNMNTKKQRRFSRMRREHKRAQVGSKAERNRIYGFTEIRQMVSTLGLPKSIRDRACVLFESAQSENLLRGRSLEGAAAAAVYATCRVSELSRTIDEIVDAGKATHAELQAMYDAMNQELGLPTGPIDPREYIPRFCSELGVSSAVEQHALELATVFCDEELHIGKHPGGVAGGCIYAATTQCDEAVTQAAVADVADVCTNTIGAVYRQLEETHEAPETDG